MVVSRSLQSQLSLVQRVKEVHEPPEDILRQLAVQALCPELPSAVQAMHRDPSVDHTHHLEVLAEGIASIDLAPAPWSIGGDQVRRDLLDLGMRFDGRFKDLVNEHRQLGELVGDGSPVAPVESCAEPSRSFVPTWWDLAGAARPFLQLATAEEDILNYLDRAIVQRLGRRQVVGRTSDEMAMPLIPKLLTNHGFRCSIRSYEYAIPRIQRIGLASCVGRGPSNVKLYTANWDPRLATDPRALFIRAVLLVDRGRGSADYWRTVCGSSAVDPVKVPDAQLIAKLRAIAAGKVR